MKQVEVARLRPVRLIAAAACAALLLGSVLLGGAGESRKKIEPPNAIDQVDYEKVVKNLPDLKADFQALDKTPAAGGALAAKLLQLVKSTKSAGGRFVTLRLAREAAAKAGDLALALAALDATDAEFEVNAAQLAAETLQLAAKHADKAAAHQQIVDRALDLARAAVRAGQATAPLLDVAAASAAKAGDAELTKRVDAGKAEVQKMQVTLQKYKDLLTKLKDPADAKLNYQLGRILIHELGDWDRALPHLAKGENLAYKLLARADLLAPAGADKQRELGDDWWTLGQAEPDQTRAPVLQRAVYWYKKALPDLKGDVALAVKRRIELATTPVKVAVKPDPGALDNTPYIDILFHRGDKVIKTSTMRFGIVLEKQLAPNVPTLPLGKKQLTADPYGITNNTCLRVEGVEHLIGLKSGRWQKELDVLGPNRPGIRSVWLPDDLPVRVTQTVELVRGEQTGKLDTCLVLYTIENLSKKKDYKIGLRFLLDTLVGTNDGAAFIIPGDKALCETTRDFKGGAVPSFLQLLENPDKLESPGTVASLRLKLGGAVEAPGRVTLGAWPSPNLGVPGADGPDTLWNVPLASRKQLTPPDSAAALYWEEKPLAPGAKREVGFSYGLGNFAADAAGKLGLIVGGQLTEGGEAEVIALVAGAAAKDQKVTLKVPDGLQIVGDATQAVPGLAAKADHAVTPLTWKVKGNRTGPATFNVTASGGASASLDVRILDKNAVKPVDPTPPKVDKEPAIKKELDRLQGTWYMRPADKKGAAVKVVVVGQTMTVQGKDDSETSFFKIDPTLEPHRIDVFPPKTGYLDPGIYKWQGDDLLLSLGERIQVADKSGPLTVDVEAKRPKAFDAKGAAKAWLLTRKAPADAGKPQALAPAVVPLAVVETLVVGRGRE